MPVPSGPTQRPSKRKRLGDSWPSPAIGHSAAAIRSTLASTTDLARLGFTYRSGLCLADIVGSPLSALCRRRVLNELQDCPTLRVGPQSDVARFKFFRPGIMPSRQLEDGQRTKVSFISACYSMLIEAKG